ncbi:MAG: 2-dehydro-3-deoxygalactonokinase [Paracoccaceae bacterium]
MSDLESQNVCWFAVDWGTTHLRVWAVGSDGEIISRRKSDRGMSQLERADFEPALWALINDLMPADRNVPVIACGMVGSRQGWADAGYVTTPCVPPSIGGSTVPVGTKIPVHIVPGVKQLKPADVMRGEETQIAGYLREQPDFDGVVCLPGTHTKWVHVSAGEIVSFQTYMTGELYSLLSEKSVLRHGMVTDEWNSEAFAAAIRNMMARPVDFAAQLFNLRAGSLIDDVPPEAVRARLSGLLIGLELAAARAYWLGRNVTIIGRKDLAELYRVGLQTTGLFPEIAICEDMALLGLTAAFETLAETVP